MTIRLSEEPYQLCRVDGTGVDIYIAKAVLVSLYRITNRYNRDRVMPDRIYAHNMIQYLPDFIPTKKLRVARVVEHLGYFRPVTHYAPKPEQRVWRSVVQAIFALIRIERQTQVRHG